MHYTAITAKVRTEIFAAWNNTCAYCKVRDAEHCDHIYPKAKGGQDCLENYAAACQTCNLMKSDMILGDGILHMIQAFAIKKAPKVASKLQNKSKNKDKKPILEKLIEAKIRNLTAKNKTKNEVHVKKKINDIFSEKLISEIKQKTSELNKESSILERRVFLKPQKETLKEFLIKNGKTQKQAEETINTVYQDSTAAEIKKAIANQKKELLPVKDHIVEFPFSINHLDTLYKILQRKLVINDEYQEIIITKEHENSLCDYILSQNEIYFQRASWQGQSFGKSLFYISKFNEKGFSIYAHPDSLYFLDHCLTLNTTKMRYKGMHSVKKPTLEHYIKET